MSLSAVLAAATLVTFWQAGGMKPASDPRQNAGRWLAQNATPDQTLVAYEVGSAAYLSGLTTIDVLGLTDPRAIPHLEEEDFGWAIGLEPDYVLVPEQSGWPVIEDIYAEPDFPEEYGVVARFAFREGQDYLLYRRAPASDER